MSRRRMVVRPGRHTGFWVEGRFGSGRLFMYHWWPTQRLAVAAARWFVSRGDSVEVRTV